MGVRALGLRPSVDLDSWWDEFDGQREVLPIESAKTRALTVMLDGR